MILHTENRIFIHIPKTGGSSIEKRLLEKASIETSGSNIWGSVIPHKIKKLYLGDDYLNMKFAPHAKAYELKELYPQIWDQYETSTIVRNPYDRFCSMYFWYTRGNKMDPEKVHTELIKKGEMMVEHQYDYVYDQNQSIIDIIFRLEEINLVFDYFDVKPIHEKNMNRQNTENFYEDWPNMKAYVRDYYVKDFEVFNYEK